jgi:hypothetical protein
MNGKQANSVSVHTVGRIRVEYGGCSGGIWGIARSEQGGTYTGRRNNPLTRDGKYRSSRGGRKTGARQGRSGGLGARGSPGLRGWELEFRSAEPRRRVDRLGLFGWRRRDFGFVLVVGDEVSPSPFAF